MFHYIYEWLLDAGYDIPGLGLMKYVSFKAALAAVISMIIAFAAGGKIIKALQKRQIGETIRDLGLEGQMQKKGTPTMGGVIIILAMVGSALLVCDLSNIYVQLLLFTTV